MKKIDKKLWPVASGHDENDQDDDDENDTNYHDPLSGSSEGHFLGEGEGRGRGWPDPRPRGEGRGPRVNLENVPQKIILPPPCPKKLHVKILILTF